MATISFDPRTQTAPDISKQAVGDIVNLGTSQYKRTISGYEPVPAATPTPTPTPTTQAPAVNVVPTGSTASAVAAARQESITPTNPWQASDDYRQEAMRRAQQQIDLVNQQYSEKLNAELGALRPEQEQAMARTNALSSLMGLSGSSSADTRAGAQGERNAKQNQLVTSKVQAEKMAAISAIYGRIDEGASKAYAAQVETNKERQKALLEESARIGLGALQSIAQHSPESKFTFDAWKTASPQEYQKVLDATGKTEYELKNEWDKAIPPEYQRQVGEWKLSLDEATGGTKGMRAIYDPITGKVTNEEYHSEIPFTQEGTWDELKNGDLVMKYPDGTIKMIKAYTPTELERSIAAKNFADAKNPTQSVAERKAKYEQQKQIAVKHFTENIKFDDGSSNKLSDGTIRPEIFEHVRNYIEPQELSDFDVWAQKMGYINEQTARKFGIVPLKKSAGTDIDALLKWAQK